MKWSTLAGGCFSGLLLASSSMISAAHAQAIPYTLRYSENARGDIAAIGNTNQTCDPAIPACAVARDHLVPTAGVPRMRNNDWVGQAVDINVDAQAGLPDSSSAELRIPQGATIAFAGLYWGGQAVGPIAPERPMRLRTPAGDDYHLIEAEQTGSVVASAPGYFWGSFADVTDLVRAGGAGHYYGADLVRFAPGAPSVGPLASWSLVVVFNHPGEKLRNLAVFDGYQLASGNTQIFAHIDGFVTPAIGAFDAKLGVVVHDGDRGEADTAPELAPFTGVCNAGSAWQTVPGNALNPVTDFYNSTISYLGQPSSYGGGSRNPSYSNTFGLDIDVVSVTLANGISDQCVRLRTGGEGIGPQALFTSIEVFQPALEAAGSKQQRNLTHPTLQDRAYVGDEIEYTIALENVGQDPATELVLSDAVPAGTTYVPGSLQVVDGPNAGAKTDAVGDDQAELTGGNVVFRVGTGANAQQGGRLDEVGGAAPSSTVRFRVRISGAVGDVVENRAISRFRGLTIADTFTQATNTLRLTVIDVDPVDPDAGSPDAGDSDAGGFDAGDSDAGELDAGVPDGSDGSDAGSSSGSSGQGDAGSSGAVDDAGTGNGSSSGDRGSSGGDGEPDGDGEYFDLAGAGCNSAGGAGGGALAGLGAAAMLMLRRGRRRPRM